MLKQKLQQKLLQKLSPQQIQMIKLLEIPTMQLEQRIKMEIEENPALEEGAIEDGMINYEEEGQDVSSDPKDKDKEEFTIEDYMDDDEVPSYKLNSYNYSKDEKREEIPFSVGLSFHDYLESQLGLRDLDERQFILTSYMLGNIDEDGYLRRRLESIADDVAFALNMKTDEVELIGIMHIIHELDPPGVGARNLQECLLLQIKSREHTPAVELAGKILQDFFPEFTRKHYDKIISRLNIGDNELRNALDEILKLNPKPGSAYSDPLNKSSSHIIPDFVLENNEGDLELNLNSRNLPELKVSKTYSEMLQAYNQNRGNQSRGQKEALSFVKQKLDSARWFIDAIKQRQNTLLVTMNAIIDYQRDYFLSGDETKLRPMILKDIADVTGLDVSTISRVANSKYVQTNFGIFALKFFFSEGMQTQSGEEVSTREIKKILQDCMGVEDKRHPLTDDALAEILNEKGYNIARRTIAKYREQLGIPVARMRKEL